MSRKIVNGREVHLLRDMSISYENCPTPQELRNRRVMHEEAIKRDKMIRKELRESQKEFKADYSLTYPYMNSKLSHREHIIRNVFIVEKPRRRVSA